MERQNARIDDFETRSEHLHSRSDEELKTLFWELTGKVVSPMIELAKTHTTPSIERSVLLRMGFSDGEAKAIVDLTIEHRLMGKGAGHCVYVLSQADQTDIRTAGLKLGQGRGWDTVQQRFGRNGR